MYNSHIGRVNPFRYKGYYYEEDTKLYYLQSRYYDAEIRRFIVSEDINKAYQYQICTHTNIYNSRIEKFPTNDINIKEVRSNPSNPLVVKKKGEKRANKKYEFFNGMANTEGQENYPSWIYAYAIYVKGDWGIGYSKGKGPGGFSIGSLEMGVAYFKIQTPKFFSSLSEKNILNPNFYFDVSAITANATLGIGGSANFYLISGSIGLEFGDSFGIGVKGFVGLGITVDFSKGIKFGGGVIFGVELNIEFDWSKLFGL